MTKRIIHIFKNDLRLSDNPSLTEASKAGHIIPIYIVDESDLHTDSAQNWWLQKSLEKLKKSLDNNLYFFKGNYKDTYEEYNRYADEYLNSEDDKINDNYFKNKLYDETLTSEDSKALKNLDLEMPVSLEKIKKNYKKLVKIFHPDVNGNNKKAEEKFKQINESYKLLLKKFIKQNGNKT